MLSNGPRIGWTIGGLGGMLWLPALAFVAWNQGQTLVATVDLLVLMAGIAYLWTFAPWKRPDTRFYCLLGGLFAILALAGLFNVFTLISQGEWGFDNLWWLFFIVFLMVPGANYGNKTWREMHGDRG